MTKHGTHENSIYISCLVCRDAGLRALGAQEPVVGASDADALFHSKDKKLDRNKQAAYHIEKDLLEANHWDEADKWLTPEYLQHNPNVKSGRDGVVKFFGSVTKPTPVPEHYEGQSGIRECRRGLRHSGHGARTDRSQRPTRSTPPPGLTPGDSSTAKPPSIGTARKKAAGRRDGQRPGPGVRRRRGVCPTY